MPRMARQECAGSLSVQELLQDPSLSFIKELSSTADPSIE